MDLSYLSVPQLKKIAKGYGIDTGKINEKDKLVGGMKKILKVDKNGVIYDKLERKLEGGRKYKAEKINQFNPVLTNMPADSLLNPANPASLATASPNFVKPYMQNRDINNPIPNYTQGNMGKKRLIHVQGGSSIDPKQIVFGGLLKMPETQDILKFLANNKDIITSFFE